MINLQKLEQNIEDAKTHVYSFKNKKPENNVDILCSWILGTEYSLNKLFVDKSYFQDLNSFQGLSMVFSLFSHAMIDDGEISFVSINNTPRIIFNENHQFDNDETFIRFIIEQFKKSHSVPVEQISLEFQNTSSFNMKDFIQMYEHSLDEYLKEMFLNDAFAFGKEQAIKEFTKYHNFKEEWILLA